MSHRQTPSHTTVLLAASGLALAASAAAAQGPLEEPFDGLYWTYSIYAPIGFTVQAERGSSKAGRAVSSAGDVNGDGVDDLLLGASGNRFDGDTGDAYVVFGRAGGPPDPFDLADLDGTNGFRLRGFLAESQTGYAVSRAGDLNHDGVDDVIIGAPVATNDGGYAAGECYVVYGRDAATGGAFPAEIQLSDLDGTDGFRIEGLVGVKCVGAAVAGAGDLNGDGIDDVIIGAARVYPAGGVSAAFVVFGRDASAGSAFPAVLGLSTLDGATGFRMSQTGPFEECGQSVAGLGDVNGDGLDDVAVGAPRALGNAGQGYVVFGRDAASGPGFAAEVSLAALDGSDGFRLNGTGTERAGTAIASAGDLNGDGTPDIAIGAPGNFRNGTSYVVFGRGDGGFDADVPLGSLAADAGFRLTVDDPGGKASNGSALASAGDLNGDGFDDLAVGAPGWGYWNSGYLEYRNYGATFVVFGRDTAAGEPFPDNLVLTDLDGGDGFGVYGSEQNTLAGVSVASAGDLNGDGRADLAIGSQLVDGSRPGAFVVYGRDVVECAADLDGDGELTVFDFLEFQNLFDAGDPRADFDGDGALTLFDFLEFQNAFDAGCE